MRLQWWNMRYHRELNSWFAIHEEQECMMYCEEWFELRLSDDRGIPCRLELAKNGYVVMDSKGIQLDLKKTEIYEIDI